LATTVPIAVPPSSEQTRIVAAIEEQFSRLDAALPELERARQNLKRMRAAMLDAAVQIDNEAPHLAARHLFEWASGKRATAGTQGPYPNYGGNVITGQSQVAL